ncbi:MAG: hypothetical protein IKP48_07865 [Bacteroidaceae bacterium]|nr:hypothetical protein [Bacteroidaceae bacterium]
MQYNITFRQLPFSPNERNIIYIENDNDAEVNQYICDNYTAIKNNFGQYGYHFIYLPLLVKEMEQQGVFSYYAPYLSQAEEASLNLSSNWLLNFMEETQKADIEPSLIYSVGHTKTYRCIPIREYDYTQSNDFSALLEAILENMQDIQCQHANLGYMEPEQEAKILTNKEDEEIRLRVLKAAEEEKKRRMEKRESKNISFFNRLKKGVDNLSGDLFSTKANLRKSVPREVDFNYARVPQTADDTFPEESRALLLEVQDRINKLRQMGVNLAILEELLRQEKKLSRMIITKKFDIILPDYNNMKVEMTPLCKALYLLFLRHPEGIMFSYLPDFHDELLLIYTQIKDGYQTESMRKSVDRLTDPFDNSINEKCARIREAFLKQFESSLAQHYVIDGMRGEPKSIAIPRDMVTWE